MSDYVHRICDALVASEAVPARVRRRLMARLGYRVGKHFEIHAGATLRSKGIEFGDGVFVNVGLYYDGMARVTVGDRVAFGPHVRLVTATHDIGPGPKRCSAELLARPIAIEDGCWLCAGVTVLPGVVVARGCVVGAGSTVVASTEPDGLYVGSPARRVRDLPA